jgi:hypothetical protein
MQHVANRRQLATQPGTRNAAMPFPEDVTDDAVAVAVAVTQANLDVRLANLSSTITSTAC